MEWFCKLMLALAVSVAACKPPPLPSVPAAKEVYHYRSLALDSLAERMRRDPDFGIAAAEYKRLIYRTLNEEAAKGLSVGFEYRVAGLPYWGLAGPSKRPVRLESDPLYRIWQTALKDRDADGVKLAGDVRIEVALALLIKDLYEHDESRGVIFASAPEMARFKAIAEEIGLTTDPSP